MRAEASHQAGALGEAERLYNAVLERQAEQITALLNLSVIRLQEGRPQEAIMLAQRAIAVDPRSAKAHSNMATALGMLDRHEAAVANYQVAIVHDPTHAEARYGMAVELQALRRYADAVALYEQALTIDPDYAEAHCGRAAVLRLLERDEEAIAGFRQALDIDPDYPEANFGIASALQALNRLEDACIYYQRALAEAPDMTEALGPLAGVLQRLNRHAEALPYLERDLAARPLHAVPHLNLGIALEEIGRLDESVACFEQALALDPGNVRALYALIQTRRTSAGDAHLNALQALSDRIETLREDDQVLAHFALGKALTDVGEPDRGFFHMLAGNALRRRQINYDEAGVLNLSLRIAATFTPETIASVKGAGHCSAVPIFIVGMPRSGSTLVEQILASHPEVTGGGERSDFRAAMASIGLNNVATPFPEAVRTLTPDDLQRLSTDYLARLTKGVADCVRITDKTLGNFGAVGLIHLALPNATIIHTRRDPIDTCLSCFSLPFSGDQPFAFDLAELGRYYAAYHALMAHWRRTLPDGSILDVHYEDVVLDIETQARRILDHCGLPWDPACLAFHKTERAVRTASVVQVRQPIYRSSVGRWRPRDDALQPLLKELPLAKD